MMLDYIPTQEENQARWQTYKVTLFWETKKNILPVAWFKFAVTQLSQFSDFCELHSKDPRRLSSQDYNDFFAYCYAEAGLAQRFMQIRRICDIYELGGRAFGSRNAVTYLMQFYASVLQIDGGNVFMLPEQVLEAVEDIIRTGWVTLGRAPQNQPTLNQ